MIRAQKCPAVKFSLNRMPPALCKPAGRFREGNALRISLFFQKCNQPIGSPKDGLGLIPDRRKDSAVAADMGMNNSWPGMNSNLFSREDIKTGIHLVPFIHALIPDETQISNKANLAWQLQVNPFDYMRETRRDGIEFPEFSLNAQQKGCTR
jgi:hypothetical protein